MKEKSFTYIVPMFPYPSGNLHMGHVRNYIITDVFTRYFKSRGQEVIHPIGFDAFGLPAENAAIQNQISASVWTEKNIDNMLEQLKRLNIDFDYQALIKTCDKNYYHHTQKIFKKFFDRGYIYKSKTWVNYDPIEKTILSNEQVIDGKGWRSGATIEKRQINSYFLNMKRWAKKLNDNLALLNWPDKIKKMQKNWISYFEGEMVVGEDFEIFIKNKNFNVVKIGPFSSIAQTIYKNQPNIKQWFDSEVLTGSVSQKETFKKEPINTGIAVNFNFHGEEKSIPVVIDPSFDDTAMIVFIKDFQDITPIKEVWGGVVKNGTYTGIKDWCLNRQRYWGTPIPVIHCAECGDTTVDCVDLPIYEKQESFSILKNDAFSKTNCPCCGKSAIRETDTLDTFFDSSWYFHHYLTKVFGEDTAISKNAKAVDWYVGGAEHANMHLIYARVFNYILKDLGYVNFEEPFVNLVNQGMVTINGEKMSKSKGNTISPMPYIEKYGSDAVRMFMIFASPPQEGFDFNDGGIVGSFRFINQIREYGQELSANKTDGGSNSQEVIKIRNSFNKLVQFIDKEMNGRRNFNVIVPQFMIFFKEFKTMKDIGWHEKNQIFQDFLKQIKPFAPNIAQEFSIEETLKEKKVIPRIN